jgi:hypothetical protein
VQVQEEEEEEMKIGYYIIFGCEKCKVEGRIPERTGLYGQAFFSMDLRRIGWTPVYINGQLDHALCPKCGGEKE